MHQTSGTFGAITAARESSDFDVVNRVRERNEMICLNGLLKADREAETERRDMVFKGKWLTSYAGSVHETWFTSFLCIVLRPWSRISFAELF